MVIDEESSTQVKWQPRLDPPQITRQEITIYHTKLQQLTDGRCLLSQRSETIDELVEHWKRDLDTYDKVKLAGIDADGVLRGKLVLEKISFLSAIKSDGLVARTDTEILRARVDLESIRMVPWELKHLDCKDDYGTPFFLIDFYDQ
ncbi:hypothetical protein PGT21_007930 [Puccinia graminis f. sp. tritici]|uniref:Uncharacterized protein n=1 Tax=Puccinia graminis f. sp. tritici TaxID=56615 RepID=A0A5B0LSY6_PUCGR|nr:hypothetical protein PGT21_007930 [Puccinia graminis f. sp. tritici]